MRAIRGYKAGGFNLDRSALKSPILPFAAVGGAQGLVGALQFDPETVDSYEIGAKYSTGPFGLGLTFFRSGFSSFQKIGRESCREIGCTYVEVSVVPGTLK